jgi:hypothetical protein
MLFPATHIDRNENFVSVIIHLEWQIWGSIGWNFGVWLRVDWSMFAYISDKYAASIFRLGDGDKGFLRKVGRFQLRNTASHLRDWRI